MKKNFIKMITFFGVIGLVGSLCTEAVQAAWKKDKTGWWYDLGNGDYAKGLYCIDNKTYYFNERGYTWENSVIDVYKTGADCSWTGELVAGKMDLNKVFPLYQTSTELKQAGVRIAIGQGTMDDYKLLTEFVEGSQIIKDQKSIDGLNALMKKETSNGMLEWLLLCPERLELEVTNHYFLAPGHVVFMDKRENGYVPQIDDYITLGIKGVNESNLDKVNEFMKEKYQDTQFDNSIEEREKLRKEVPEIVESFLKTL